MTFFVHGPVGSFGFDTNLGNEPSGIEGLPGDSFYPDSPGHQ